jgi:hypothetical protein
MTRLDYLGETIDSELEGDECASPEGESKFLQETETLMFASLSQLLREPNVLTPLGLILVATTVAMAAWHVR